MFFEQFAFESSALVNFVGGGGKTALIQKLLHECPPPKPSIYTTTTRIHPPSLHDGLAILSSDNAEYLKLTAESIAHMSGEHTWKLVITGSTISPGLLGGVAPDFANRVNRSLFSIILNEADGARGISLKVPREGEPVLMEDAQYLVPVIGIDCLEKPLGPDIVFRWDVAEKDFALSAGQPLTTELAAMLMMNPAGICKGWQPGMRIVPYINKVDGEHQDRPAERLARALLTNNYFPVERVVYGSLLTGRASMVGS